MLVPFLHIKAFYLPSFCAVCSIPTAKMQRFAEIKVFHFFLKKPIDAILYIGYTIIIKQASR
jgi:hypothetical protein